MAAKTCSKCGDKIPVRSGPGRPRTKCLKCSPPDPRRRRAEPVRVTELGNVTQLPGAATATAPVPTVAAMTERKLRDAGLLDDPAALVVLELARSIDGKGHSGASLASLSREFRAALADALADHDAGADSGDGVEWGVG